MENLRSIYRLPVFIGFITSSIPFVVCYKCPGVPWLPRMELVANGTQSSQTEIPNRSFPKFFYNWKTPIETRPHSPNPSPLTSYLWLVPRAGKMNQILWCDWLPDRDHPRATLKTKRLNKRLLTTVALFRDKPWGIFPFIGMQKSYPLKE